MENNDKNSDTKKEIDPIIESVINLNVARDEINILRDLSMATEEEIIRDIGKQKQLEKQNPKPYKIESGYTPGVDGGYYYHEYKTKKEYEFSKIFPWIVLLVWIVLGYLLSVGE